MLFLTLTLLSCFCDSTAARPSRFRRQTAPPIEQYLEQVNAARYAVDVLQVNNATNVCNSPNSTSEWDGAAYDPVLAEQLVCESAIGIVVFPDLNIAATNLDLVFTALQNVQQTQHSNLDAQTCAGFDPSTLDAAGLDGEVIVSVICSAATSSSAVPLSAFTPVPAVASGASSFTLSSSTPPYPSASTSSGGSSQTSAALASSQAPGSTSVLTTGLVTVTSLSASPSPAPGSVSSDASPDTTAVSIVASSTASNETVSTELPGSQTSGISSIPISTTPSTDSAPAASNTTFSASNSLPIAAFGSFSVSVPLPSTVSMSTTTTSPADVSSATTEQPSNLTTVTPTTNEPTSSDTSATLETASIPPGSLNNTSLTPMSASPVASSDVSNSATLVSPMWSGSAVALSNSSTSSSILTLVPMTASGATSRASTAYQQTTSSSPPPSAIPPSDSTSLTMPPSPSTISLLPVPPPPANTTPLASFGMAALAQVTITIYETVWVAAIFPTPAASPLPSPVNDAAESITLSDIANVPITGTVTTLGTWSPTDTISQAAPIYIEPTAAVLSSTDTEATSKTIVATPGTCTCAQTGSP
ncbi:hypothetical protein LTR48_006912 [Friedmanniomyces endolithicus]|uniref:Uncharacterized protein n=1 Tax=Rachicladosporium monterosium TaxID=1507873 RepID=A0ABR0KZJ8_9PEZI|nr:hypothetical protein LTR48_006912 [Friedmanniomyces endolithicus]KAK5140663.1 hypothetical protein LTR32_006593 [Rachicladosporium monterosium]